MHPLLREYALERLDESGERPALEARHAAVMTELAERLGAGILTAAEHPSMRHIDHEAWNLRAAVDWSLANDRSDLGLRTISATWRWYQQRGRLREGRALLEELLARPAGDVRVRIAALSAAGGLAYWMDDIPAARAAYEERLGLAEATGDPSLVADAHYDLGFVFMVLKDEEQLRYHEQLALDGYVATGREQEAVRARQAFVLALFLAGQFEAALEQQEAAIARFRERDAVTEIADSQTLLSAILFRLDDPDRAWHEATEALRVFDAGQLASGTARAMVMASILQIVHGDAELGTRIAGATYRLAREQNVMLAPVTVLHLPDPKRLADERLGPERTTALLEAGEATPLDAAVATVLGAPPPGRSPAAPPSPAAV
jgi:tetratricopeptide (TPR) repeat protein